MSLDRQRASGVRYFQNIVILGGADQGPLVVDLAPPFVGHHWIVEAITFYAQCSQRVPGGSGTTPISGLFLCPPNTPPETFAIASSAAGWSPQARGLRLPLGNPQIEVASIGGAFPNVLAMMTQAGFKFTVPNQWFLRAILVCAAGTATPGPGPNSFGLLGAAFTDEADC